MTLGAVIRKVKREDRDAVLAILRAAFKRATEAAIVEQLWNSHAIKLERVAEIGGVVNGYVCYSTINTQPELKGVLLGLGPLAVAPDHQNQGVGAMLVTESLKACQENGALLIAVLGDPAYYSRFGFEPASKSKMSWAGFDAGDAFQILGRDDLDTDEIRTIHYHKAFDMAS
ncbi:MAG: N-acetyltransferase [Marinicaulis sp.]|nr:N-acetyltransferase [Marinicaulis sp.]